MPAIAPIPVHSPTVRQSLFRQHDKEFSRAYEASICLQVHVAAAAVIPCWQGLDVPTSFRLQRSLHSSGIQSCCYDLQSYVWTYHTFRTACTHQTFLVNSASDVFKSDAFITSRLLLSLVEECHGCYSRYFTETQSVSSKHPHQPSVSRLHSIWRTCNGFNARALGSPT
jgi:hypothetical protein